MLLRGEKSEKPFTGGCNKDTSHLKGRSTYLTQQVNLPQGVLHNWCCVMSHVAMGELVKENYVRTFNSGCGKMWKFTGKVR